MQELHQTALTVMPDNDIVSRVDDQGGITIKTECQGNMLHCPAALNLAQNVAFDVLLSDQNPRFRAVLWWFYSRFLPFSSQFSGVFKVSSRSSALPEHLQLAGEVWLRAPALREPLSSLRCAR